MTVKYGPKLIFTMNMRASDDLELQNSHKQEEMEESKEETTSQATDRKTLSWVFSLAPKCARSCRLPGSVEQKDW